MKQIIFLLIIFFIIFPNYALADIYRCGQNGSVDFGSLDECKDPPNNCNNCVKINSDTPSPNAPVSLDNPLGRGPDKTDIPILLGKIINSVMGIIGSLALVMFIYGGATWMLSSGNQEQVTRGKNTLIWAAIGLVIIFTAYALVNFVLKTVTNT